MPDENFMVRQGSALCHLSKDEDGVYEARIIRIIGERTLRRRRGLGIVRLQKHGILMPTIKRQSTILISPLPI